METIAAALYEEPIDKFISRDVETVRLDDPVALAASKYNASPYRAVLVEDADGRLAGLITDDDLTKLLGIPENTPVRDIATSEVVAIKKDANMAQLFGIIKGHTPGGKPLKVVPVVDDNRHPVGIIYWEHLRADIAEAMLQKSRL
jgi:CBS domain-containing protein